MHGGISKKKEIKKKKRQKVDEGTAGVNRAIGRVRGKRKKAVQTNLYDPDFKSVAATGGTKRRPLGADFGGETEQTRRRDECKKQVKKGTRTTKTLLKNA